MRCARDIRAETRKDSDPCSDDRPRIQHMALGRPMPAVVHHAFDALIRQVRPPTRNVFRSVRQAAAAALFYRSIYADARMQIRAAH
jgi:hypothetical protein